MHASTQKIEPVLASTVLKCVFYAALGLAAVSIALAVAGRHLGHGIALAGHTEDTTPLEIVMGNSVLNLPANMIRFESQRQNGVAKRVDLYLHWPDMQGYRPDLTDDFNGLGAEKRLVFATLEPRMDPLDMSQRYGPVYATLTTGPGIKGPSGLTIQRFRPDSGYANEELVVSAERAGTLPFIARCLDATTTKDNFAGCQRDIFVGEDLQLTYRFPRELLQDWREVEEQMRAFARDHMLRAD